MFSGVFAQTKWREPYLVGRCLGAAENVRFIGCYGGSKPPPYGVCAQTKHTDKSKFESHQPSKGMDFFWGSVFWMASTR